MKFESLSAEKFKSLEIKESMPKVLGGSGNQGGTVATAVVTARRDSSIYQDFEVESNDPADPGAY